MTNATKGSVVYCDPPFMHRYHRRQILPHTIQIALVSRTTASPAQLASMLAYERQIPVLISNHETALTKEWYVDAKELHSVKVRRTISSNTLGRSKVNELLALYK